MRNAQFLTTCSQCGATTSKAHARANEGKCKACACEIMDKAQAARDRERDNALLIDSGYQAFARERGDYDQGDC